MWIGRGGREHLSTSITVVNLSPVGSVCLHSRVMRDVQNCDSNNTTHVGQPQKRDVTKAAPLHWFETVGPGGHSVTWDRGPGGGRVLVQLVDMTRQQWRFAHIQVDVKQASTLGLTKIQVDFQDQMWRRDIEVGGC